MEDKQRPPLEWYLPPENGLKARVAEKIAKRTLELKLKKAAGLLSLKESDKSYETIKSLIASPLEPTPRQAAQIGWAIANAESNTFSIYNRESPLFRHEYNQDGSMSLQEVTDEEWKDRIESVARLPKLTVSEVSENMLFLHSESHDLYFVVSKSDLIISISQSFALRK